MVKSAREYDREIPQSETPNQAMAIKKETETADSHNSMKVEQPARSA